MAGTRTHIIWQSFLLLFASGGSATAADFHVSNKIHFKPGDKPVVSTTVFATGRVYDFMVSPMETIVFDPAHDLIVMLDPNRQVKTEVTTGEISTQIGKLREAARNHKNERIRDLAVAKFAETVDPKSGKLILTNRWMSYEMVTTPPKDPQAARQYAEFADWLAQLNAKLNPAEPPFPRLALNEVLRQRQELPLEITRKTTSDRHKELVVHSEHTIIMSLSHDDQKRVQEAHDQMHMFAKVSFDDYHRVNQETQAAAEESLRR